MLKVNPFMQLAIEQARKASHVEVPIGAVIVGSDGNVLATAHNLVETSSDPTAHAEMLVIRTACEKSGSTRLTD